DAPREARHAEEGNAAQGAPQPRPETGTWIGGLRGDAGGFGFGAHARQLRCGPSFKTIGTVHLILRKPRSGCLEGWTACSAHACGKVIPLFRTVNLSFGAGQPSLKR